jgi:two-component system chemotaxis response regulator CheY
VKLLLVEESRVMRQFLVRALRQGGLDGYDVLPAEDGRAAVRVAREDDPEVVVSGWNVPGLHGPDLVSSLRKAVPRGRIVVVSAEGASPTTEAEALRAGADVVLAKPVVAEDLVAAVDGTAPARPPVEDVEAAEATAHVPTPYDVRDVLVTLLGRDVTVEPGDPFSGEDGRTSYAVFVDDRLATRMVAVADTDFSTHASAAVGLVPPPLAESAARRGALPELLADNLDEVLNVCGAAVNGPGRRRVRLWSVHRAGLDAPADVVALAAVPGRRLDLVVAIPSYGSGRLSFVAVD